MVGAMKPTAATAFCVAMLVGRPATASGTRCWLDRGAVVAAAAFGDIAGDFIIDLSRPVSGLHATRANMAGIVMPTATAALEVAGGRLAAVTMPVVDLDAETRDFATSIAGVIGWDVLGRYEIDLDLRHGACRLALGRRRPLRRGNPLTMVGGAPAVAARITDGRVSREGLFWIDTGRAASRVADTTLSRPMPTDGAPVRLRAVSIAGALVEQIPAEPAPTDNALGGAVWAGARLRIDPANGRWTVTWPRKPG
jgi:hypothetical protein